MKPILKKLSPPAVVAVIVLFSISGGCHRPEAYDNDAYGNFDALWTIIDEHYCFLDEKHIDWDSIGTAYRSRIEPEMTVQSYFDLLADMLAELKDGHVNLVSRFNTSYYRKWWSDYPQDFNLRCLQQHYLKFDYSQTSGISYRIFEGPDSIGYMYYPSFANTVGNTNLDYILASFKGCKALIIDIRNNGGGQLTNIGTFVGRFIDHTVSGGFITHKTGPGHSDFSEPFPVMYDPAPAGRVIWKGPVAVLTNRSCFSAANDFVSVMKSLPDVSIIGARTGGGGGMPFSSEIPIGWTVRFSASPMTDSEGNQIEDGIDPTPGMEFHSPADLLAEGKDVILDNAIRIMAEKARNTSGSVGPFIRQGL